MSVKGKELGLYSISDYSPHGLNLPKLEVADGGIVLTGRFSAGSSTPMKAPKGYEKFHKPGQKYNRPNWTFIPKIEGEMKETLCTSKHAKEVLGWKPKRNVEEWLKDEVQK